MLQEGRIFRVSFVADATDKGLVFVEFFEMRTQKLSRRKQDETPLTQREVVDPLVLIKASET